MKPTGWNAINTNGEWWHEFEHEHKDASEYNWAIIDNTIADEDTMPPVWLPVSTAKGFIYDAISCKGLGVNVDMSADAVEWISLYDTTGPCCSGYEWEARVLVGSLWGVCNNPDCPKDGEGTYHGASSYLVETIGDVLDMVDGLVMYDKWR